MQNFLTAEQNHRPPSDGEFTAFQKLILERLGIYLPPTKKALLVNRLWKRLCAHQFNNYHDYYCYIMSKAGRAELELALELITTNETYFFREQKHFDYMSESVIPLFRSSETLRIWSAAASSGEEPYSIAMLLADRCVANWELLCSDVNGAVLEQAKKGIYSEARARNIPPDYKRRFCLAGTGPQAGHIRVVPDLRARPQFFKLNLNQTIPSEIGKFDLIFLRNILIYFDNDTKIKVLERIAKTLKPNGLLFVGHSDSLHGMTSYFSPIKPAIYRLTKNV